MAVAGRAAVESVIAQECAHGNRLEYGAYALCFDCGAERKPVDAPAPAPSIREQRLQQISELVTARPVLVETAGVKCPVCGSPVASLHALTAHASAAHMTAPVAVTA